MEILLIRLMRSIDLSGATNPQPITGKRQCAAVKQYIDVNFKKALTLERLASEAHMYKFYLSHTFKRSMVFLRLTTRSPRELRRANFWQKQIFSYPKFRS